MSVDRRFPGLILIRRADGREDRYWRPNKRALKDGFTPRTVPIPASYSDDEVESLCGQMQIEMFQWLSGGLDELKEDVPPGTVGWLCHAFEKDPDSPFHEKRAATKRFYRLHLAKLVACLPDVHLDTIIGRDVRGWHRTWKQEFGERTAYAMIQTLRRVASYGTADLSDDACIRLGIILKKVTFPQPKARTQHTTYVDVAKLREVAREAGRPSIALAVTLQFELSLRQRDVIGEWSDANTAPRCHHKRDLKDWAWGLTWSNIDTHMVLRKATSKSNGREIAVHDLRAYPDAITELERIPLTSRVGPIVLDEDTGLPWVDHKFRKVFRQLKARAGWDPGMWNMDTRAGAVSEAFEAGATGDDVMKMATHRMRETTERYNRGAIVQMNRVAGLRIASRAERK